MYGTPSPVTYFRPYNLHLPMELKKPSIILQCLQTVLRSLLVPFFLTMTKGRCEEHVNLLNNNQSQLTLTIWSPYIFLFWNTDIRRLIIAFLKWLILSSHYNISFFFNNLYLLLGRLIVSLIWLKSVYFVLLCFF